MLTVEHGTIIILDDWLGKSLDRCIGENMGLSPSIVERLAIQVQQLRHVVEVLYEDNLGAIILLDFAVLPRRSLFFLFGIDPATFQTKGTYANRSTAWLRPFGGSYYFR